MASCWGLLWHWRAWPVMESCTTSCLQRPAASGDHLLGSSNCTTILAQALVDHVWIWTTLSFLSSGPIYEDVPQPAVRPIFLRCLLLNVFLSIINSNSSLLLIDSHSLGKSSLSSLLYKQWHLPGCLLTLHPRRSL